ncbi:hypothetical protein BJ322DRAFT_1102423 [Thelephora terrestris]|uniref:Uncharacterized protein n=1 Tax=Thelephora terrestris TaxID=56493 RepID=A0A9P6LC35_9AGAM|nr:hypothetical protein BJ322DRAFT_1102423 [Thelephora terrestris]
MSRVRDRYIVHFLAMNLQCSGPELHHLPPVNPYTQGLLSCGVDFVVESNETHLSILDAAVTHTSNLGVMLMDEVTHVNKRIDTCQEAIERIEKDVVGFQEWTLMAEDGRERQGTAINLLKGEVTTLKDLVCDLVVMTKRVEDERAPPRTTLKELLVVGLVLEPG